jgi:hypothetical protein
MRRTPNYRIIQSTEDVLVIQDIGPWDKHPTVTNAAEDVVAALAGRLGARRLFYFDSEGERAEIIVRDGKFAGFAPVPSITNTFSIRNPMEDDVVVTLRDSLGTRKFTLEPKQRIDVTTSGEALLHTNHGQVIVGAVSE